MRPIHGQLVGEVPQRACRRTFPHGFRGMGRLPDASGISADRSRAVGRRSRASAQKVHVEQPAFAAHLHLGQLQLVNTDEGVRQDGVGGLATGRARGRARSLRGSCEGKICGAGKDAVMFPGEAYGFRKHGERGLQYRLLSQTARCAVRNVVCAADVWIVFLGFGPARHCIPY